MISVIIPTFNRASTLKLAVESVINQGNNIKEVIIIDDNSTDNTEEIIKSLNNKKIKYIKSSKNIGACAARNKGIELSSGEYIAFHDSDDIWESNKIERQISFLKAGYDVVCSGYNRYMDDFITYVGKNIEDKDIYSELLKENFIGTPTIIGKTNCFKENKFDKELPRFQDWDLMLRIAKKYKVKFIDEALVKAYVQRDSISRNNNSAIEAMKIIINKNKETLNESPEILEGLYRRMGVLALDCNEDYKKYFKQAFNINKSKKSITDFLLASLGCKNIIDRIHKR